MTVEMEAAAELDLDDAFAWYESEQPGLGVRFIGEFRRAVDRMLANPLSYQLVEASYRRCQLHHFPYGILYRVDEATRVIRIFAVMHLARRPQAWRRRMT